MKTSLHYTITKRYLTKVLENMCRQKLYEYKLCHSLGEVSIHTYLGGLLDPEEKDKLARNLGPNNKILLLSHQGALCCGETIEEAFFNAKNTVLASESQLKLLPIGLDNLGKYCNI